MREPPKAVGAGKTLGSANRPRSTATCHRSEPGSATPEPGHARELTVAAWCGRAEPRPEAGAGVETRSRGMELRARRGGLDGVLVRRPGEPRCRIGGVSPVRPSAWSASPRRARGVGSDGSAEGWCRTRVGARSGRRVRRTRAGARYGLPGAGPGACAGCGRPGTEVRPRSPCDRPEARPGAGAWCREPGSGVPEPGPGSGQQPRRGAPLRGPGSGARGGGGAGDRCRTPGRVGGVGGRGGG